MKKFLTTAGCMLGGGMMGFSAGRLNSVIGAISFVAGLMLLMYSTSVILKKAESEVEEDGK